MARVVINPGELGTIANEFGISTSVVGKDDFKEIKLTKGESISIDSFDKIVKGMPRILPDFNTKKPSIKVGFEMKEEKGKLKPELLGPLVSIEGHYEGKDPSRHISVNDPDAMKLIVHFGTIPRRIKLEIESFASEEMREWVKEES
jgi:hypothetical protein